MRTFWRGEVDNVAVALEHVDLLNLCDGLDVHFLEDGLQLLVIGAGGLVDLLDLPPGCTLATTMLSVLHTLTFTESRGDCGGGLGERRCW